MLDPGDLINTGTPQGVALSGRFPYLTAGDVMEVEIDGLGRQRNTLRRRLMRCDGLVAVVTGGGSGIGLACVRAFAAAGARVGVLDLELAGLPEDPGVLGVRADVADRSSLSAAVASVAERFGGIDILVNNAAISAVGTVEENDDEQWSRVLDVNVSGVARTSAVALPYLRRSSSAAIVNISSIAATTGLPKRALYSASKGAVHALTLAMAADLVTEGVRVNCVAPGTVDTPWVARLLAGRGRPDGGEAPVGRPPADRPTGDRRRGGRRRRLPGLARNRVGDGYVAGRRRRHVRPAIACPALIVALPEHS